MSSLTTIFCGDVSAKIDSAGAQLMSLVKGGDEYLWQRDATWWNRCAPVLFPVVGTPGFDTLRSQAGLCRVPKHGFARDFEHRLIELREDGAAVTYELRANSETLAMYPYPFVLRMTYEITEEGTVLNRFFVENTGSDSMPFALGGHPAFNVPVPGAEETAFEDYELRFIEPWSASSPKMIENGIMSYADPFEVLQNTDTLALRRDCFAYDTIVLRDVPGSTVSLVGKTSGRGVRIDFADFDFIGIWSAAPDAPFVALEPWTGHAALDTEDNVFEHRDNVVILDPGASGEWTFGITPLG